MRFDYAALLIDLQIVAARATGQGWKIIDPQSLPKDNGRNICVFVGGAQVMGTRASLPLGREAEVRKAVPFAAEDEVATELTENHFAIGPRQSENAERDVRVVTATQMTDWIAELQHFGLNNAPIFFVADVLPGRAALLDTGSVVYGRVKDRVFCLESDMPADVFVAMVRDAEDLQVFGTNLAQRLGRPSAGEVGSSPEDLLLHLLAWDVPDDAVNLRQGQYSVSRRVSKQQILNWRSTAAIFALTCIAWFGSLVLGTRAIEARTENIRAASAQLLAAEIPEANGNLNLAMSLYADNSSAAVQPLPSVVDVTALLYKAVSQLDSAEVRSLRYDAERREAISIVAAKDFAAIEALSEMLTQSGLVVFAGDARQDRSGVVGELKLGAS